MDYWNTLLKISRENENQIIDGVLVVNEVGRHAFLLLSQAHTAGGGDILRHEIENFINKHKIK